MGQPYTPKALALGVSLSLACGLMPAAAFAEEVPATDDGAASSATDSPIDDGGASSVTDEAPQPAAYDKADFYSDNTVGGMLARSLAAPLALSYQPVSVSEEMKYFAKHESGRNYDQGLSRGDGYHAMGYYQFDNRYVLSGFLTTCYQYDPETYSMFGWVASTDITGDLYDKGTERLTETGQKLNDSWHAAYTANPSGFSSLQDSYAYTTYYTPAENYLKSRGIDISNRSDCVKGLCWGLSSLFGSSGWHKFVGGVSDGYDWKGTYHYYSEGYNWPGAGLANDMTDEQFVTALCNYVVKNVSVFYKGQPDYHQGWENRYRAELAECKAFIASHGDSVAPPVDTTPVAPPVDTTTKPEPDPVVPSEDPEDPSDNAPEPEQPADGGIAPDENGSSNGGTEGSNSSSNEAANGNEQNNASGGPTPDGSSSNHAANGGSGSDSATDGGGSNANSDSATNGGSDAATAPNDGTVDGGSNDTDASTETPGSDEKPGSDVKQTNEIVDASSNLLSEPTAQETKELPKQEGEQTSQTEQASEQTAAAKSGLTQTGDDATRTPLGAALVSACVAAIAGAALSMRRLIKRP